MEDLKDKLLLKALSKLNSVRCALAHDIKTPIAAQKQAVDFLLTSFEHASKDMVQELLNHINVSSTFVRNSIENALHIIDFDEDNSKFSSEFITAYKKIQERISQTEIYAQDRNQKFKLNLQKDVLIIGSELFFQKIIDNLLICACGISLENKNINISLKEKDDRLFFLIKCHAYYISKEKIQALFSKYKENSVDFNALGTSTNINIAKTLIETLNWEFIFKSSKKNFCTFGFSVKREGYLKIPDDWS